MRCVSMWMHCVQTDEGKKKKKEKKRRLTYRMGMCMQRGGHTDGLVGMWTRMCCVHADEYKGKKKKKKKRMHFVGGDGGHVGLRTCCMWTCWCADADAGGGRA